MPSQHLLGLRQPVQAPPSELRVLIQTPLAARRQQNRALHRSEHSCRESRKAAKELAQPLPRAGWSGPDELGRALERLRLAALGAFAAAAASALLGLSQLSGSCQAQEMLRFPASHDPAIFLVQRTMVEAWSLVDDAFFDSTFAGREWDKDLAEALTAAYTTDEPSVAYKEISAMLQKLGDPFTRIVPPAEFSDFKISSDGEVQGVGLLISTDPSDGRLVVLASIAGSPAEKAGVQPGDEVLSIDGRSTKGWDGEHAAKLLRGDQGSSVNVRFGRRSEQVPGVAGRAEPAPKLEYRQVKMQRERLELTPVYSTAMQHDGHNLGYIRLASFSQNAASDMRRAIDRLEDGGAEGFILDLRSNPGGLVRSGVDIARLFLRGPSRVFNIQGRVDPTHALTAVQHVALDEGLPETSRPLTVLVNGGSASASEILAGALHDSGRAVLVGDRTFGKGKIQSVFELGDGSALFVTVARYTTPKDTPIDKVGIVPDKSCSLGLPGAAAGQFPSGIPMGTSATQAVLSQLQSDSCILTAEKILGPQLVAQKPRL